MQKERLEKPDEPFLTRLRNALRANRKLEAAVYAALAVLVLVLYLSGTRSAASGTAGKNSGGAAGEPKAAGTDAVEARLKRVLSSIRGAGEVEVMITYETGRELVTAMTSNVTESSSTNTAGNSANESSEMSEPATVNGANGNEPIVLYEKEPQVRGVLVVADGAADVAVRMNLQRAVQAVLDVPLSNIEVFERSTIPLD